MRKKLLVFIGIILTLTVVGGAVKVLAQGPSLPPGEYDLGAGQYVFNVPDLASTETPIPPTETPVPPPTDTPVPLGFDTWHPLTQEIGHEHGLVDPNSVNDIFGEPGCWFGICGQSISYPFETPNENATKHEAYDWIVFRDLTVADNQTTEVYVKDIRWLVHFTGGVFLDANGDPFGGYLTRFHSNSIEANVCRVSDGVCGIVRTAGFMDTGCLKIDGVQICLPGEESMEGENPQRAHTTSRGPDRNTVTWYGRMGSSVFNDAPLGRVITNLDMIDGSILIFPDDILNPVFICPNYECVFNDSFIKIHQVSFRVDVRHDDDGDGLVTLSGFTGTDGKYDATCTAVSPDCVPFFIENAPVGHYNLREGRQEADISPPGEFWIRHPN